MLSVRAAQAMDVAAGSLVLNVPLTQLEVLGVYLAGSTQQSVPYQISGTELRIGWFSSNYLALQAGQPLFTLHVRVKQSVGAGETIRFALVSDPLNELGDPSLARVSNAELELDVLETTVSGLIDDEAAGKVTAMVYPNPFRETATVDYTLPYDGRVLIEVYDMLGKRLECLLDAPMKAGNYSMGINAGSWSTGFYMLRLQLESGTSTEVRTIRIAYRH